MLILILISATTVVADNDVPAKQSTVPAPNYNLLEPFNQLLSGRPWLITEGLDPALKLKNGGNPITGPEWGGNSPGSGGSTGRSEALQSVGGGFLVPYRSPAPAFSRDILISRDYSGSPIQTEPHIAVNPEDPDHVVVGMIDYAFPSPSTYVTFDGGSTWEGPHQTGYLPDDLASGGDPVLAYDRDGNLYLASISIGIEEFSIGPVFQSSVVSSIAVARSQDGGYHWPQITSTSRSEVSISEQQIDPSGRLRGSVSISFLDKPWMTIGPDPENLDKDISYVTYTHFETFYEILYMGEVPMLLPTEVATTIKLVKSTDKGTTWSDPIDVSSTVRRSFGSVGGPAQAPGQFASDRTLQGSHPAVDPAGNVHVAWVDSTDDGSMEGLGEIHVASSTDAGKTFSESTIATVFNEIPFRPRNASFRYWGSSFPRMESGPKGELYLVYTGRPVEKPTDDGDVFFLRSLDQGKSWSDPIPLNDDDGETLQFFPEIAVGPEGNVHVMWADMRDDPSRIRYHIYYTTSEDQGETWGFELEELQMRTGDARVSDFGSNPNRGFPNGLFLGDYFGIAATTDDVYMVWADTRLAEFGGINQKIAFARRSAIRTPDIFISPSAGSGGEQITIQGFNFQPSMNVYIQLQDSTIAVARTNKDGRFTAGIYIPVTGEGAQNVRVFDESGNMATTSFYTEFGFGNIKQLYEDLLGEMQSLNSRLQESE